MSTKDPVAFGQAVLDRREQLGLSQIDVWQKRGPSNTTLTVIENGRMADLAPATARKLDSGLDWEPGSALGLWRDGTPPIPVASGSTRPQRHRVRAVIGDAAHLSNLTERVEELEFRLSAVEALVYESLEGGDGNADADTGGSASNTQPGSRPEINVFDAQVEEREGDRSTRHHDAPPS